MSPGTNAPVIGIVQDTLIGSYMFTHQTNYLSENDVRDLVEDALSDILVRSESANQQ